MARRAKAPPGFPGRPTSSRSAGPSVPSSHRPMEVAPAGLTYVGLTPEEVRIIQALRAAGSAAARDGSPT